MDHVEKNAPTFFRDAAAILLVLLLYNILIVRYDLAGWEWRLINGVVGDTVFYGIPTLALYSITVRKYHSNALFFIFSWGLVFAPAACNVMSVNKSTNYTWGNHDIIKNGEITFYGLLFLMISPFIFAALFATYKLIFKK